MQRRGLPAAHPSLPLVPISPTTTWNNASTSFIPPHTSSAPVTATLSGAYPPLSYSQLQLSCSSHYAQAYLKSNVGGSPPTAQDYTPACDPTRSFPSVFSTGSNYPPKLDLEKRELQSNHQPSFNYYQSGNSRCTYKSCSFSGSHKVVEIHMMDRHLIYPLGWENRTKKSDWDADTSLKGKPIPIQGTTIILDTPEVLEAWIAERKKRWPSTIRVEEKKKKLEEAVARGQLSIDDSGCRRKRRKMDGSTEGSQTRNRQRECRDNGRDRGRRGGRSTNGGWLGRGRGRGEMTTTPSRDADKGVGFPSAAKVAHGTQSAVQSDLANNKSSSDDDEPEVISSRPLSGSTNGAISLRAGEWDAAKHGTEGRGGNENVVLELSKDGERQTLKPPKKVSQPLPKKLPRNPFASRPTLLRNLLLPEIRITISNLSQAVRFLVDNDFLDGVELKPGQGNEKMIKVISPSMEGKE